MSMFNTPTHSWNVLVSKCVVFTLKQAATKSNSTVLQGLLLVREPVGKVC